MPMEFFNLLLSLVDEEELRRNAFWSVCDISGGVLFNSQVPLNNLRMEGRRGERGEGRGGNRGREGGKRKRESVCVSEFLQAVSTISS